jgi:hypothetical protein
MCLYGISAGARWVASTVGMEQSGDVGSANWTVHETEKGMPRCGGVLDKAGEVVSTGARSGGKVPNARTPGVRRWSAS